MKGRPLRFCMITTFYPPYSFGGDAIYVHRLANELARRGHQVEVIHCMDTYRLLAHEDRHRCYDDQPNVTVHGLESPWGRLSPLATQQTGYPLFKSASLRRILARGFDVIHYHNVSTIGGPKILEYGWGLKLYTIHEYWLLCPTHVMFRFNRVPCTRRRCILCGLMYKRPPQWWRYSGLLSAAVKHVDAFIAPSRFSKDLHQKMGLSVPTVHLPYFVPVAEVLASDAESSAYELSADPYFLFVGRLERLKGLQTLIPVFRHYRKAQLWVAGTGRYEPQLRKLGEESANVRFLGHLSQTELQVLYRRAVAVIVPSVCLEVFPLVTIEAFRQATPAIVRNLGGMPEAIEDSGAGFTYSTEEELLAAMDQLLADPSRRRLLGLRGYDAYQQKWSPQAHLDRYLALIENTQ